MFFWFFFLVLLPAGSFAVGVLYEANHVSKRSRGLVASIRDTELQIRLEELRRRHHRLLDENIARAKELNE